MVSFAVLFLTQYLYSTTTALSLAHTQLTHRTLPILNSPETTKNSSFSTSTATPSLQKRNHFSKVLGDKTLSDQIDYVLREGFDWRDHHIQPKVKDQGLRNSCVSHAITSALEGFFLIHHNKTTSWSTLDLYYCVAEKKTRFFFEDVLSRLTELGVKSSECTFTKSLQVLKQATCSMRDSCTKPTAFPVHYYFGKQDKYEIMHRVRKQGPVIGIIKWTDAIEEYAESFSKRSGWKENKIFYAKDYAPKVESKKKTFPLSLSFSLTPPSTSTIPSSTSLNSIFTSNSNTEEEEGYHAVLVLGYGFEGDAMYWIVQNSHGKSSGEKGILYIGEGELEFEQNEIVSFQEVEMK